MARIVDGRNTYFCPFCEFKNIKIAHFRNHLNTHTGQRRYKCSACSYSCILYESFITHLIAHTKRISHKCNLCSYTSTLKQSLNRHMLTHTKDRPFECTVCPFSCTLKSDLKNHMLTHTKEKPFKCSLCSYASRLKNSLNRHMLTHTNEKPFECTVCPFSCTLKSGLKNHMSRHTNEKSFKCTLCSYSCNKNGNLETHMFTHTKYRPYECTICSFSSKSLKTLNKHMLSHTRDSNEFAGRSFGVSAPSNLDKHIDSDLEDVLINNVSFDDESDEDQLATIIQPDAVTGTLISSCKTSEPSGYHQQASAPVTDPVRPQNSPPYESPNIWKNVTDLDTGHDFTIPAYNVANGPTLPTLFDADSKPIDYFDIFFNDEVLSLICHETNLFANERQNATLPPQARLRKWKDIGLVDLKAFLGTVINMELMPLPSIESYFSTEWDGWVPFFRDVFKKDDFLNILWNLHFNHAADDSIEVPKDFLIAPILDHMKKMSRLFYTPSNCVSVDECTISLKGQVSFRVCNPMMPTKFGLKICVVTDSKNGYLYDFIPYFGREHIFPNTNLSKSTQIVKLLAESVVMKDPENPAKGLHVFTNMCYTSPELANELLELGCYLTGTVMTSKVGMPVGLKGKGRKMKKGDLLAQRKGPSLVVSWKDKRTVHMLSTFSKGSKREMKDIPSKLPNKSSSKKPNVVINYIKNVAGGDHSDNFLSSYQFMGRTKKWYRKMFFWLFEVGLINAYLLYKQVQQRNKKTPLTRWKFRKSLVRDLVAQKMASRPEGQKHGLQARGPPDERLNGKAHFMSRREKGSRVCVVCLKNGRRRETIYFCKTCTALPTLHPNVCFEQYHTLIAY